ncbi:hypothetical protein ACLMJK_008873 [Lecanora helva]
MSSTFSRNAVPLAEPGPQSHVPVIGNWDSSHTTIGAGVAIFHLASSRVVVCYHPEEKYWFLPKGRRDIGEDSGAGAEREGFEESKNAASTHVTEPVWTQLAPISRSSQYILFWYIAETLPPELEAQLSGKEKDENMAYQYPPKFDPGMTLKQRVEMEAEGYEPIKHEGTGVDSEEVLYESYLLPVEEAMRRLGRGVMADVVRRGWEQICVRKREEERGDGENTGAEK